MTDTRKKIQELSWVRIVDDDTDHNKATEFLLRCKGWQVISYTSAQSFLTEDVNSLPGCIVLDVHMPELSGLELQQIMKEREIILPIIFLTGYGDIDMAVNSMIEGAVDFLQKPVNPDRLLASVEKACTKSVSLSAPFVLMTEEEAKQRLKKLTAREIEILELVNQELPSRLIGERLGISERTVETHRTPHAKNFRHTAQRKSWSYSSLPVGNKFEAVGNY